MMSSFDQCSDGCGWVAGIIAALAYGSFGVPIKATKHIDVHPLVLQSYKTFVMFMTCWGVIFLDVDVAFTKWGLLSGFMWVVGGTGGIYGIRMAGLAIAVGTWASIMIIVNFIFGILVFHEPVHDMWGTMGAFLLLILGLVGMSRFSAPQTKIESLVEMGDDGNLDHPLNEGSEMDYQAVDLHIGDGNNEIGDGGSNGQDDVLSDESEDEAHAVLFGGRLRLTKRQCGILGASWNGLLTGGSLIPLHYAKEEGFGGARYMISMACGAFISNCLIWLAIFLYKMGSASSLSFREIFYEMPKWHFRELVLPGFLAGLLLSVAMFGSILSITYLGQGVGNSLVQTKILVSGLWGILWYKEITGRSTVLKWFFSAFLSVVAIIWLSLERIHASGH